jgi:thioredoxin reductase
METSIKNLFAIGDVNNLLYPCVATAVANGVVAAKEIETRAMGGV